MQCSFLKRSPHPTSPRGGEESPLPASPRGGEGKTIEDAMKGEEISKKL
jgi:hypothetical protein